MVKRAKPALLFPAVVVKSLPACQECGGEWARLVGPRRSTRALVFQACVSCAATGMGGVPLDVENAGARLPVRG
jgi:hypothetical protein